MQFLRISSSSSNSNTIGLSEHIKAKIGLPD